MGSLLWCFSGFYVPLLCGPVPDAPGRTVTYQYAPTGGAYFQGTEAYFSCSDGKVLDGDATQTCLNYYWSGEPQCVDAE